MAASYYNDINLRAYRFENTYAKGGTLMILCCKHCGNCRESNHLAENCDYCGNEMVQLLSDEELSHIDPKELPQIIEAMRAGYRYGNPDYDEKLWDSRTKKEEIQRAENEKKELDYREKHHMVTTGFQFEGYEIVSYLGIVAGEVVLGTGFLSEFTSSFADFFGVQSGMFEEKLETARHAAMDKLIKKSAVLGGNAVIGIDIDYNMFSNNVIGVIANGTSVVIRKI